MRLSDGGSELTMDRRDGNNEEALRSLPAGIAMTWGLVKEPTRGPKRELSVRQIVAAAVAIADREGLGAVSMARVASSLGFTAMSLYRYIPGKDDLLALMQEAVCDVPVPEEDVGWREGMRRFVYISIEMFARHPWYVDIPISGAPATPNVLRMVDWLLRLMRDFPMTGMEKMGIVLLLSNYSRSCGILQRDLNRAIQAGGSLESFSGMNYAEALKVLVTKERFPDLHPVVATGAYTGDVEGEVVIEDDFDFGLNRILDGVEQYLRNRSPGQNE